MQAMGRTMPHAPRGWRVLVSLHVLRTADRPVLLYRNPAKDTA